MAESKNRRDKRFRMFLTDKEHAKLMQMALKEGLNMCDIIRNKVFKEK